MPGGGELGHVHPDLGDQALGGPPGHTGDAVEVVTGPSERGDHLVDAVIELADGVFELGHVFEPEPQHHPMMVTKPPAQRLPQRG